MMKTTLNKEYGTVTIEKGGEAITLTFGEIQDVSGMIDEEVYFREDVMNEIKERVESGFLDAGAADDKEMIDAVTARYAQLRRRNDGDADGMTWRGCLETAMEEMEEEAA